MHDIDLRSTVRSTVRSEMIKETFPPETGMQKKQVLQDPGYVDMVRSMLPMQQWKDAKLLIVCISMHACQ